MIAKRLAIASLLSVFAGAALAQTAQPVQPTQQRAPTAPAAPAVATPAKPAVPAPAAPTTAAKPAAASTQSQIVNLNTAAPDELDKLPQIGAARAKAIVENRTKNGRFKNWDDFVARNVVPGNAEAAIKDKVRF